MSLARFIPIVDNQPSIMIMARGLHIHSLENNRLSANHPNLVGILLILLENPESRPISDWDRKNPDLEICSNIFE